MRFLAAFRAWQVGVSTVPAHRAAPEKTRCGHDQLPRGWEAGGAERSRNRGARSPAGRTTAAAKAASGPQGAAEPRSGSGTWGTFPGESGVALSSPAPTNWCRDARAWFPPPSGSRAPGSLSGRRILGKAADPPPHSTNPRREGFAIRAERGGLEITDARRQVNPKPSALDWDAAKGGAGAAELSFSPGFRICGLRRPLAWTAGHQPAPSLRDPVTCFFRSCVQTFLSMASALNLSCSAEGWGWGILETLI